MKIALLVSSLRSGGAERVASIVANYWAGKGREVLIFTLVGEEEPPFYDLDSTVRHVPMGVARLSRNPLQGLVNNLRRAQRIRREIAKTGPDILVSFMDTTNVLAILATRGLGVPVVVAERNNPVAYAPKTTWKVLRDLLYARADVVVTQTERARACFPSNMQARCVAIPNPVLSPSAMSATRELKVPRRALTAMGRLCDQKDFPLLVSVFARLVADYPNWHLVIIGDGPQREDLERQIAGLGIQDHVLLTGQVRKPEQVLRQSDLFVLSSRYEGFPNALCEAMACGLPVVSFDCPFGPAEIIRDGIDGILVSPGDRGALEEALGRLMGDEGERLRLAQHAPEIVQRLGLEKVMDMWEEVLQRAMRDGR